MSRNDDVLTMQVLLMPELAKEWNVSYPQLAKILQQYQILDYIDAKYDMYNSTGTDGVVDDLTDYVKSKEENCA